jgi:DNA-binding beta-propeller fold protein YncE
MCNSNMAKSKVKSDNEPFSMSPVKIPASFLWIAGVVILCFPLYGAQTKSPSPKDAPKAPQTAAQSSELVWPLPPDPPRVRWLAEYTDMAKVKNPVARKPSWIEKVTGTKTPEEKQELRKPYGIATDSRGRIYTADTQLKTVYVIDPIAKVVEERQDSRAPMVMPVGLAVDSEDRLFVSDAELHTITCFNPAGQVIARFGTSVLGRPGGIAIDRSRNRLYAADAKESRIAVFDSKTLEFKGHFGTPTKAGKPDNGTFAAPTNVAVDRQGNIYVADTLNYRVQILDPAGKFIRAFGQQGDRPGEFIRPKGIAVDSEGHIYVADAEFNNFQVFSPEGQSLLAVGALGGGPGQFALIAGLYIDSKDRIYTTEMYMGRIQVFQYIPEPASTGTKGMMKAVNH